LITAVISFISFLFGLWPPYPRARRLGFGLKGFGDGDDSAALV